MSDKPRPQVFKIDDPALARAPEPTQLDDDPTLPVETAITQLTRKRSALSALVWTAVSGLIMLVLGAAAYDFVLGMMAKNVWLGRLALALGVIVLAGLLLFVFRELAALSRMSKVDDVRQRAEMAWDTADRLAASRVKGDIETLYRSRADFDRARDEIRLREGDAPDADTLLTLIETEAMQHLDARASAAAQRGARSVAAATALLPAGILDAAAVLFFNVRMVREIAEVYGGRAGWLGSWRLLKQVAVHLAATGMIALGDDFFGAVLGGGALAKLSRRAGEGAINGALTARIGVAAIEVSRPLPYKALTKPGVRSIAAAALTRFRQTG